jgi:glycosyltransferase involved in cell wall biosynthesis
MSSVPDVSVVMSVFNGEPYVARAIDSILTQTYRDFEFIIVDDGSDDHTLGILENYKDPRIRLISRQNRGLATSLNEGIAAARGRYIARQDADDVSRRDRLSLQLAFLEAHPEVGLLGTNYQLIDEQDREQYSTEFLTHWADLKIAAFLSNQFGHGSVIFRKGIFDTIGRYDPTARYVEDFDLWVRFNRVCGIANLAEPLYLWRVNPNGISFSNLQAQREYADQIRNREFDRFRLHLSRYPVWSYHPRSFGQGLRAYHEKKSAAYRDVAYLYLKARDPSRCLAFLSLATIVAPWRKKNYKCLLAVLVPPLRQRWPYDYF